MQVDLFFFQTKLKAIKKKGKGVKCKAQKSVKSKEEVGVYLNFLSITIPVESLYFKIKGLMIRFINENIKTNLLQT